MGVKMKDKPEKATNPDSTEFSFKFKLNGQEKNFSVNVDDVFSIDTENLKQELTNEPGLAAWLSVLVGVYTKKAAKAKDFLKMTEANLMLQKKRELSDSGERASEYVVRSMVYSDPDYRAAAASLRDVEHDNNIIIGLRKAIDHKRDCLVQLTGLHKKEMDNQ